MPFPDEGFFHALQQDPQDDALRLVYSDFLEDRGEEASTAQAELIRVQVELAALSPLCQATATWMAELTARQDALLDRWQRVWLGDGVETLHGWRFRRGLLEAVHTDASLFLDNAADWFARWPTLSVAKLSQAGDCLPELASSPWLAHLRGLDLSNNGIDSAALAALTSSRFVCLLQALDLSHNPIEPRGASLLATAGSADELSELHLADCGLWHEGLLELLGNRASNPTRWRRLDLSANGLYRFGLVHLVDSPLMSSLESLDLARNPLGDNGASALADSPNVSGLVELGLSGTGSGNSAVVALAASPDLTNLRSLDLRGHQCWPQGGREGEDLGGIAALARSPRLAQLRRLLVGHSEQSNGWTAQVLKVIRPSRPVEVVRYGWVATELRKSRYLMPSQLVECDIEELWWLGDTRNRERLPSDLVAHWLGHCPEVIKEMDAVQATLLRMRYGLDQEPKTLKEIGERLGLSRERLQEIEGSILRKLRTLMESMPND